MALRFFARPLCRRRDQSVGARLQPMGASLVFTLANPGPVFRSRPDITSVLSSTVFANFYNSTFNFAIMDAPQAKRRKLHDKIAFVGHSFIWRFEDYLNRNPSKDRHFKLQDCEVSFHGVGGLSVYKTMATFEKTLKDLSPSVIVLHIGDNDVTTADPQTIASAIIGNAFNLREATGAKVVINQMMPRYPPRGPPPRKRDRKTGRWYTAEWRPFNPDYNSQALEVNREIERQVSSFGEKGVNHHMWRDIVYWPHHFVLFPDQCEPKWSAKGELLPTRYEKMRERFLNDGTHLHDDGNLMLYRSYWHLLKSQALQGKHYPRAVSH